MRRVKMFRVECGIYSSGFLDIEVCIDEQYPVEEVGGAFQEVVDDGPVIKTLIAVVFRIGFQQIFDLREVASVAKFCVNLVFIRIEGRNFCFAPQIFFHFSDDRIFVGDHVDQFIPLFIAVLFLPQEKEFVFLPKNIHHDKGIVSVRLFQSIHKYRFIFAELGL